VVAAVPVLQQIATDVLIGPNARLHWRCTRPLPSAGLAGLLDKLRCWAGIFRDVRMFEVSELVIYRPGPVKPRRTQRTVPKTIQPTSHRRMIGPHTTIANSML
jgi:hypothetical protein